jgi:hypothetical protein
MEKGSWSTLVRKRANITSLLIKGTNNNNNNNNLEMWWQHFFGNIFVVASLMTCIKFEKNMIIHVFVLIKHKARDACNKVF